MPSRAETLREVTAELQKKISRPAFARRIGLITGERIVVRVTIEGTPYYTERQPRLRDWRVILEDPTILSHHRRVLVELRDGGNRIQPGDLAKILEVDPKAYSIVEGFNAMCRAQGRTIRLRRLSRSEDPRNPRQRGYHAVITSGSPRPALDPRHLKAADWKEILRADLGEAVLRIIRLIRPANESGGARLSDLSGRVQYARLSILTLCNQRFKMAGLPFRIRVVKRARRNHQDLSESRYRVYRLAIPSAPGKPPK